MTSNKVGRRAFKTGLKLLGPMAAARRRGRLRRFCKGAFQAGMNRPCQQKHCYDYVRGLLAAGRRKSMLPIALRLGLSYEALQHFVTDSTWQWKPVLRCAALVIEQALAPVAWLFDDTGQRKQGKLSPGVGLQYLGEDGCVQNSQAFVSMLAASETDWAPMNWRLFLPKHWAFGTRSIKQKRARKRARLPDDVTHVPKWRLALDMAAEALDWGLSPRPVLADIAYGKVAKFRAGLSELHLDYVVEVMGKQMIAHRADESFVRAPQPPGPGGRTRPRYHAKPRTLASLARGHAFQSLPGVRGSWLMLRVRPCGRGVQSLPDGSYPEEWLIVWARGDTRKYYLSNLPADTTPATLAGLAQLRWDIECSFKEGKQCLGLDHFEGRTFPGWMHHITLYTLAHLFAVVEALDEDDGHEHPTLYGLLAASQPAFIHDCQCPTCGAQYGRAGP
jgi:SRSO17 transposase